MDSYILSALDSAKIDFQQKANDGCLDATNDLVGIMSTIDFIEQVAEIAFGDNAINRDFSPDDILDKLREHSDNAWKYEDLQKWKDI